LLLQELKKPPAAVAISGRRKTPTERATESFMVATGCRVVDGDWRERVVVGDWEMNVVQVGSFILGGMDVLSHVIPEIDLGSEVLLFSW
jgi:hypothetical protein